MKSTAIFLSLAALFILAGCQTAKAPENGTVEDSGGTQEETVSEEASQAPASDESEAFVNPNYDAKLDGDPTKAPTVEKDEVATKESSTKVDQGFMSDPEQ